jgi:hypothetical protein
MELSLSGGIWVLSLVPVGLSARLTLDPDSEIPAKVPVAGDTGAWDR